MSGFVIAILLVGGIFSFQFAGNSAVSQSSNPELAQIATWNLGSLGDGDPSTCAWAEDFFPHRDEETLRAMAGYIQDQDYEILALQEIEDREALGRLLQFLPEYEGIVAREDDCLRLAFIYQPAEVSLQYATEIRSVEISPGLRSALVVSGQFKREDGFDFRLVNVHLKCCEGQDNERKRERQLSALNAWLREQFRGEEDDIMVLGDFNEQLLKRPDAFQVLASGIQSLDLLTEELENTVCTPQNDYFPQPVDHIVTASSWRDEFSEDISLANIYQDPSLPLADSFADHCPVSAYFSRTGDADQVTLGPDEPEEETTVFINEFEQNPPCNDSYKSCQEPVELYNPTDSAISVGGWRLQSTKGTETPALWISDGTTVPANGFAVVEQANWLDNSEEAIVLYNASGTEVDRTPALSDGENDNGTWQRCPDGGSNWEFRLETLGASNGC